MQDQINLDGDPDRLQLTEISGPRYERPRGRLPDSELVVYPDAGHGAFQSHDQFVENALESLEPCDGRRSAHPASDR